MEQTLRPENAGLTVRQKLWRTAAGFTIISVGAGGVAAADAFWSQRPAVHAEAKRPNAVDAIVNMAAGRQIRLEAGIYMEAARISARNEVLRQGMLAAKAIQDYQAEQQRQQQQQRAAAARRSVSSAVNRSNDGSFLDCVRIRESEGQYGVVNSSSGAAGAYQFMQGTWNHIAEVSGRGDLVGVNPASASPADQDAMAASQLSHFGPGAWSGGRYAC